MSALAPAPLAGPTAWGEVLGHARVAAEPADFLVDEQLGFGASQDGPHLLVQIQKTELSTAEASQQLAAAWGVAARDIGHAGRKDRQAVTRQWLSVPWPDGKALPPAGAINPQLQVLGRARHRRKLRVGAHTGNRFRLVLRDVNAPRAALNARLQAIAMGGVPNYFGPQRFGRNGSNLERAWAWLVEARIRPRGRTDRGMLLSTARSECFNRVLAERVAANDWNRPGTDDVMMLDGRGSIFLAATESPARLRQRAAGLSIHPTGPLPGRPGSKAPVPHALAAREAGASAELAALTAALDEQGVEAGRRALRMTVGALGWHWRAADVLVLEFTLPSGGFATTVVRELLGDSAAQ